MNILLMGLESRTDYDGNILPANLLAALHAGSVQGVEFDGVRISVSLAFAPPFGQWGYVGLAEAEQFGFFTGPAGRGLPLPSGPPPGAGSAAPS